MTLRFLLQRIAYAIFSVWAVCTLTFFLTFLAPGDPAELALGQHPNPVVLAHVRHDMGLDRPPLARYVLYIWNALHGDLGRSIYTREPVVDFLRRGIVPTAILATCAMAVAIVIGVLLGVAAAWRPNTALDRILTFGSLVGITLPNFVLAPIIIGIVGLKLHWLPVAGWGDPRDVVLPSLVLAARPAALIARMTRASTLETQRQDYVRTARAKGLHPATILFKHVLKNAALPVLTTAGVSFGYLLSGSFVVETIFTVPGLGYQSVASISTRDYSFIQGTVLLLAVVFVTVNLLVDLLYSFLDPRVKLVNESRGS